MRPLFFFIGLICTAQILAQAPIFEPTMTITELGVVDSPIGEEVDKVIDGDVGTKFLDFELFDGMGFTVDLGGVSAIATVIEITTANDFPVRDPIDFEITGSNDGTTFVPVDTGSLPCIDDRFFTRQVNLTNTIDFQYYRINFTNACDPSGGTGIPSIQLAEVQLLGEVLSTPDVVFSDALNVYPNPIIERFTLEYLGHETLTSAVILDLMGRKVVELPVHDMQGQKRFDLSQLPSGMYFLKIQAEGTYAVKRLIKK